MKNHKLITGCLLLGTVLLPMEIFGRSADRRTGRISMSQAQAETLLETHINSDSGVYWNFQEQENADFWSCVKKQRNYWGFTGLARACILLSSCSSGLCRSLVAYEKTENLYRQCEEALEVSEHEYYCRDDF